MLSEFFMNMKIALLLIDILLGKSTNKAWNIVSTSIDWITYSILCILAIYFVTEVMADYANKKTSMSSEEHPITEHPQISICFNNPTTTDPVYAWKMYELGSEINITVVYGSEGSQLILEENENVLPESPNESIIVKRSVRCYTLIAKSKEFHPLSGQQRQIKLEFSPKVKALEKSNPNYHGKSISFLLIFMN